MNEPERGRRRGGPPPGLALARPEARQYAAWFRALGEPTRIQIMSLLGRASGPLTVGEIVSGVDVGQATVSQHLKVLAGIGLVLAERRGTAHRYRLNDACLASFPAVADLAAGREPPGPAGHGQVLGGRSPAGVTIRPMAGADASQVLAIYQAGLDSGEASFETQAPSWEVFDAKLLAAHRHVAAASATGAVLGWAAASGVSERCVYQGVAEASVYVAPAAHHRGIGAALLDALVGSTEAAGIWTVQAGIFPENTASLRLHQQAGFRVVGIRARLGCHRGRWRDVVLLERRSARAGTG